MNIIKPLHNFAWPILAIWENDDEDKHGELFGQQNPCPGLHINSKQGRGFERNGISDLTIRIQEDFCPHICFYDYKHMDDF